VTEHTCGLLDFRLRDPKWIKVQLRYVAYWKTEKKSWFCELCEGLEIFVKWGHRQTGNFLESGFCWNWWWDLKLWLPLLNCEKRWGPKLHVSPTKAKMGHSLLTKTGHLLTFDLEDGSLELSIWLTILHKQKLEDCIKQCDVNPPLHIWTIARIFY
jgi:hypothetical protein